MRIIFKWIKILARGSFLSDTTINIIWDRDSLFYPGQKPGLSSVSYSSTPTLAAWPLRGRTALKLIFWETLFLDQLHDFSLLSFNSFLHQFLKSKFMKKPLDTRKISSSKPNFALITHRWAQSWLSDEVLGCSLD